MKVELDAAIDLDALWASMAAMLKARGVTDVVALATAERLFWQELGASEDWLELTTSGEQIELVGRLAPAFQRRFIAQAMRELGLKRLRAVA